MIVLLTGPLGLDLDGAARLQLQVAVSRGRRRRALGAAGGGEDWQGGAGATRLPDLREGGEGGEGRGQGRRWYICSAMAGAGRMRAGRKIRQQIIEDR